MNREWRNSAREGAPMNRWRLVPALLVLLSFRIAEGQAAKRTEPAQPGSGAREILKLEDDWAAALVRRDTAMFRERLAPRFVYTEDADVTGKKEVIEGVV